MPDAKLVTKNLVTGQYGIARVTVSHKGKFFYREVKAPTGYEADTDFHLIDTSTTVDLITRVEVENEKITEPFIRTTATGADGEKTVQAGNKVTIVDTVSYFNLKPGKTYIMKGTLMNKEAGKALTVDGKKVTAEKTFTPKTKDGTVKLTFTFNANTIKDGSKLVVFEKCYEYDTKTKTAGKLIAKHTDINDEGQTVIIKEKPEKPNKPEKPDKPNEVPKTGDQTDLCRWIALLGLAFLGMLLSMLSLRSKQEDAAEEKQEG